MLMPFCKKSCARVGWLPGVPPAVPPLLRCRALSLAPLALMAAGHTPCPPARCTQLYGAIWIDQSAHSCITGVQPYMHAAVVDIMRCTKGKAADSVPALRVSKLRPVRRQSAG